VKDSFGQAVNPGDVIVYSTRQSSSQFIFAGTVKRVNKAPSYRDKERETLTVDVFAGDDSYFRNGTFNYDAKPGDGKFEPYSGRTVTLTSPSFVKITGFDPEVVKRLIKDNQVASR